MLHARTAYMHAAFISRVARLCGALLCVSAAVATGGLQIVDASPRTLGNDIGVAQRPLPHFPVRGFRTVGSYPLLVAHDGSISRVNLRLAKLVRGYENRRLAEAEREEHGSHGPGLFGFSNGSETVTGNGFAVSILENTDFVLPDGNDGSNWFAAVVAEGTGRLVRLNELFKQQRTAARLVSSLVLQVIHSSAHMRSSGSRAYRCVERSLHMSPQFLKGLSPDWSNFRNAVLRPRGVTIAFAQSRIASPACGDVVVNLPYAMLRKRFNREGTDLSSHVVRLRRTRESG